MDGLVNTADDGAIETIRKPGNDGILGDGDDEIVTLLRLHARDPNHPLNYDSTGDVNPNLRQVVVTVRYKVESAWRNYTLVTYMSSYS